MSIWFFINSMIVLYAIWKITAGYHGLHMIVGGIGLLLIIYNWTRHAVFSSIRSKKTPRKRKILLANISKKVLPIHKWTGSTALLMIVIHLILVVHYMGFHVYSFKMLSGIIALFFLFIVVGTGWLRWYRTTVGRRYVHWIFVYLLVVFVLVHLLI